jgi:hypothetical protein
MYLNMWLLFSIYIPNTIVFKDGHLLRTPYITVILPSGCYVQNSGASEGKVDIQGASLLYALQSDSPPAGGAEDR